MENIERWKPKQSKKYGVWKWFEESKTDFNLLQTLRSRGLRTILTTYFVLT